MSCRRSSLPRVICGSVKTSTIATTIESQSSLRTVPRASEYIIISLLSSAHTTTTAVVFGYTKMIIEKHENSCRKRWNTVTLTICTIFSNCITSLVSRMVLFFLIPVNMMFGVLPSYSTLDHFHFPMVLFMILSQLVFKTYASHSPG